MPMKNTYEGYSCGLRHVGIAITMFGIVCIVLSIVMAVLTPSPAKFIVKVSSDPNRAHLFYSEQWHLAEWIVDRTGANATLYIDGQPILTLLQSFSLTDLQTINWIVHVTCITLYVGGYPIFAIGQPDLTS